MNIIIIGVIIIYIITFIVVLVLSYDLNHCTLSLSCLFHLACIVFYFIYYPYFHLSLISPLTLFCNLSNSISFSICYVFCSYIANIT